MKSPVSDNYYYNHLTPEQKKLYKKLASGMRLFSKSISLPIRPINEIGMVYEYVCYDNPDMFCVSGISYRNDLYKKRCVIQPTYKHKRLFALEKTKTVQEFLHNFDAAMTKSDYEKALYVHDYCLDNFKYDYSGGEHANSILGCILNRAAVCEGIAKFAKLALDYLGIESIFVPGKATDPLGGQDVENHAWNIVNIEGRFYHLDITFDMTISEQSKRYDYFCLSDEDIKKDHSMIADVPRCETKGKDYYSLNKLAVKGPKGLESFIGSNLKQGNRKIVVKLLDAKFSEKLLEKISKIAQNQCSAINKRSVAIEMRYNASQMIFEIHYR
jgi:hypothetical protein